ncbi:enoyl-[acyl-carrier-protein] reductase FabL [Cytobacillus oceanisediminis]
MSSLGAVLVVGGTKGIGRAIALRFSEPGRTVVLVGHRDEEAARTTAAEVAERGARPVVVLGDVSTAEGCTEIGSAVAAEVDRLDVVVHGAVRPLPGPLLGHAPADIEEAIRTGGTSLLHLVRVLDHLLGRGSAVFFLSSLGAQRVVPGYGAIGVAKATAEAIVRYLAVELAPRGARVNTVSCGPIGTDAYREVFADADARLKAMAERTPAGRGTSPEDVAELVHRLSGPGLEMVQGQHVRVDGGLYLS